MATTNFHVILSVRSEDLDRLNRIMALCTGAGASLPHEFPDTGHYLFDEEIPFPNDTRIVLRVMTPRSAMGKVFAQMFLYDVGGNELDSGTPRSGLNGEWRLCDGKGNTYIVDVRKRAA